MAILISKFDIEIFATSSEDKSKFLQQREEQVNDLLTICKRIINELPDYLAEEVISKGFRINKQHPYLWNCDRFDFYYLEVSGASNKLSVELEKHYRSLAVSKFKYD